MHLNELTISDELKAIAYEIKGLKNNIGYSFFEIGRRVKIAKEKNSNYGEWKDFLELTGLSKSQADRLIVVFDAYSTKELPDVGNIGLNLAYEIATLPDDYKQKQFERLESGEKITNQEIRDLKKQLRQKDMEITDLKNQPKPEPVVKTVEVEKEVIPDDYETLQQASKQLEKLKSEHQRLLDERAEVNEKSQKYDQLNEAIAISQGKLNATQKKISEYNNLHKLIKESNDFLTKASGLVYADISGVMESDPVARQEIIYLLGNLERFTKDLNQLLETNLVIEGEIIND